MWWELRRPRLHVHSCRLTGQEKVCCLWCNAATWWWSIFRQEPKTSDFMVGPLKDSQTRVLKGEPSPRSQVSCTLEQVFFRFWRRCFLHSSSFCYWDGRPPSSRFSHLCRRLLSLRGTVRFPGPVLTKILLVRLLSVRVISNFHHFTLIEAAVLLGTLRAVEMLLYVCPDRCLTKCYCGALQRGLWTDWTKKQDIKSSLLQLDSRQVLDSRKQMQTGCTWVIDHISRCIFDSLVSKSSFSVVPCRHRYSVWIYSTRKDRSCFNSYFKFLLYLEP